MSTPGHIILAGSIVRSADVKSTAVKGQCLQCGRRTIKRKPVLRYSYVKYAELHMIHCTVCSTYFESNIKEDVMRQVVA